MKHFFTLMLLAFAAIAPSVSYGQQLASKVSPRDVRGATFRLCNAETANGICDGTNGDLYAVVDEYSDFSFFFSQAGGTGATCNIFAIPGGTAPVADLSTLTQFQINATALSSSNPFQAYSFPMKYVYITCAAISGGSVTVDMMAKEPSVLRGQ